MNSTSILITGASGFIGSHLVETAIKLGYETWAAVRSTSSREYLSDTRIRTIELNLDSPEELHRQLATFQKNHRGKTWDYIIHAAGATKATSEKTFMDVNCRNTQHLADTLAKLGTKPRRFVYLSSLSATPPAEESATTAYGRSKLCAEHYLLNMADSLDVVILRPTAVYGPRERDFLLAIKALKHHICIAFGKKQQRLSFIYVKDLCSVAFKALTEGKSHCVYLVSDGKTYTNREVTYAIQQALRIRHIIRLTLPLWLLKVLCCLGEKVSQITKHPTLLNNDKYKILQQRDWTCNPSETEKTLGIEPEYDLSKGLAETVSWYKQQL